MKLKVIQGHIRPLVCPNHSSTYVYGPILNKKNMNANMKTQHNTIYDMKSHFYFMEKFCNFDLCTVL